MKYIITAIGILVGAFVSFIHNNSCEGVIIHLLFGGIPGGFVGWILGYWVEYIHFKCTEHAALNGNINAMYRTARYYWSLARSQEGDKECRANYNETYNKAIAWYQRAAELGHAEAAYVLGYCYEKGDHVGMSVEQALEYYELAASQKHKKAQFRIKILEDLYNRKIVNR